MAMKSTRTMRKTSRRVFKKGDCVHLKGWPKQHTTVQVVLTDEDTPGVILETELRGAHYYPHSALVPHTPNHRAIASHAPGVRAVAGT